MPSKRISGITIEIDGNTQKLNNALKDVDRQLSSTQSQLKDVEKLLKLDPKNTELLSQKQKLLTEAIGGTKDRLAQLEKAQADLAKRDSTPEVTKQQEALQREIIATKKQLEGFEDELGKVPSKASLAFNSIGEGLDKAGQKMSSVGEGMTKYVTAPITAAGAAAVAAFGEVDNAMDTVILKTGATGEAAQGLQSIVENLATTIPTDFDTAANAVGELNTKFGLTGEALEKTSATFIKFANVNNKDVSSSIDNVQKAMSAYGLSVDKADHFLDVLTKTSQDTGADVDKLTDGVIQNATAFEEMGLSVDDAIVLMGQMERSGANSETVMNGLRKALKNATKDGKPLARVLGDLEDEIKNSNNATKALNDTYELFGKSGDQIYGAIKNGTLSFKDFGTTLETVGGTVERTFDATLDGVDNWRMAMNEVKLIGADIGGILSEFAGPILTKVRDALTKARNAWRGLSDDQQDNIIKIAGIVAAMGPALTLMGKMTSAVGSLSKGIGLLIAHPIAAAFIGGAAAIAGVTIALKNAGDAGDRYLQETVGLNKEMRENIQNIEDLKAAYDESVTAKNEAIDATSAEYDHLQDLAEEYDTLIDSNGKVKEGYEDRAEFIMTTLSESLGIERDKLQAIIDKNGELASSIDTIIEKRKAEAVLNQLQDGYSDAVIKSADAYTELIRAEANYNTAHKKVVEIQKEMDYWSKVQTENAETNKDAWQEACDQLGDLRVDLEYATAAESEMSDALAVAEETYLGYQGTIKQYEGLSAAVIGGDAEEISRSLSGMRQDFKTTETATTQTLKSQRDRLKQEYDAMKIDVENGSKHVTQADLREKAYWLRQAQLEYNKSTAAAREAARSTTSTYANQIAQGRSRAQEATRSVTGGVKTVLDGARYDAERSGSSFVDGFVSKITAGYWRAQNAGRQLGGAAANALNSRLSINSPSKVTAESGKWFTEGFALGIEKDAQAAIAAASNMAGASANALNQQAQASVVAANPYNDVGIVGAFRSAMSGMKVILDDEVAGAFVEDTVSRAVYQF